MKLYQIAELEQLTGVKAHTIRIWEQRYGLIKPVRTETNIRRYNNVQVKKMLNVTTLLSKGYKISKIAALKESEILDAVINIQKTISDTFAHKAYINNLTVAMLNFDEPLFENIYQTILKKLGVFDTMLHVMYPLLNKIGIMWVVDNATPIQEHFVSNIIKRKLMAAINELPMVEGRKKKKFLLMLPPNEWHDIGLIFAQYIIKAKGFETVYFGQNVPYENMNLAIKTVKPTHVIMLFIATRNWEEAYFELKKNVTIAKNLTLLISGNSAITNHLENKKNLHTLKSPSDLLTYLI